MSSQVLDHAVSSLLDDECYARNLIGGRWQFPAAPYEFEIRNPADSTITAVVPLSSRFDVAQALHAATDALRGAWATPTERTRLLTALLDRLDVVRTELARLQSVETGLTIQDSADAIDATLRIGRSVLPTDDTSTSTAPAGVSGHILSWGLPFAEIITSVLPALARGGTAIVKPSLRGPLTPVAFAFLATEVGLPAGVVNIVQGTGVDVGADLISRRELSALHVRAGQRTIAQAERSHERTGVPLHVLHGGGNATIVVPGGGSELTALGDSVVDGVRVHNAGGPFGVPLLAVHRDEAQPILAVVLERLSQTVAAPLPTEPLRRCALDRISTLVDAGAELLSGGDIPDDVTHRMGWRIPPTVMMLGEANSTAFRAEQASVPLGPVLGIVVFDSWTNLASHLTARRGQHGVARIWGTDHGRAMSLSHGLVTAGPPTRTIWQLSALPAAWLGGGR